MKLINKHIYLIALIVIILFLLSCKKENTITDIEGEVINFYSQSLISGGSLRLTLTIMEVDPMNPQLRQLNPYDTINYIEEIRVNQEGFFHKRIYGLKEKGDYRLVLFNDSLISEDYNIITGKLNNIKVIAKPLRILNVKIKKVNNQYYGILIYIDSDWKFNDYYNINGEIIDTSIYFNTIPDANCFIDYYLYDNNNLLMEPNYDTIYITNTDTIIYEIIN